MKGFTFLSLIFVCILLLSSISCSEDDNTDNGITPSNLIFTANIIGQDTNHPNGDGSGIVTFTLSAQDAHYYKIAFGDGQVKEVSAGTYTYTYGFTGTKILNVSISAYRSETAFISKTISVILYANQGEKPIWAEEFDVDGPPNSSNWTYDIGASGWGNNEVQYYTNRTDNAVVQNGVLKITSKKETFQGANYTSARLKSQGLFSFQYGRVEVRAKLPSGGGTWPAIWMLGDNFTSKGWPACGEIDIMEHKGNQENTIYGTVHYPDPANPSASINGGAGNGKTTTISNATSAFHIYGLQWSVTEIIISVDGTPFYSFPNTSSTPFNQKFFFILNIAMGGKMGGTIDPNFTASSMEIDYIRVYNN